MKLTYVENLDQYQGSYLEAVRPVRVYYCSLGRNAWRNTWIGRYRDGCIHTQLETAREFAEKQRKQGSVFYIRQLPALLLIGYPHAVISQINTDEPLSGYSRSAVRIFVDVEEEFNIEDSLEEGNRMRQVVDSFRYNSSFWTTTPPPKSSVITLFYDDGEDVDEFEDLDQGSLLLWKSRPNGRQNKFRWDRFRNRIDGTAVLRLAQP